VGEIPIHIMKLGGAMRTDPAALAPIADGARPGLVVVHGGGAIVTQRLAERGLSVEKIDGIRPTHAEQLPTVIATLTGEVNTALVAGLRSRGVNAVGLTLADGHLAAIEPADPRFGFVGTVAGGDGSLIRLLAGGGFVPVIAPIGLDASGALRNINADDAAAGLAAVLNAESLTFVSDTEGVLAADGTTIEFISSEQIEPLIESGVISGGMAAKVRAAAMASAAHGIPVRIGGVSAERFTIVHTRAAHASAARIGGNA